MGTPTRLRHYRAQPSASQTEAEENEVETAKKPTPSMKNFSTSKASPKEASHSDKTTLKNLTSTTTSSNDNTSNTSRRTFAITPIGPTSLHTLSNTHKRSSSNETSISSEGISSISSISNASSALKDGGNDTSYASIVASKKTIPTSSSSIDDGSIQREDRNEGGNGESSYRFFKSAVNTATATSQAEAEKSKYTAGATRDSLSSSSSLPSNGSKMSTSSSLNLPINPSYQINNNNGENDPFRTAMSYSTSSSNNGQFRPLNWMSPSSTTSSTVSPFRQASLQPNNTSTPERNGNNCHWKENPYQLPSSTNWSGSQSYFAPFATHNGVRDDRSFNSSTSSNQTSSAPFGLDWQSFDNSHSRSLTQNTNSTNSINNEGNSNSSLDRSFKTGNTTADTSASMHGEHSVSAFDQKATFPSAPIRHTRQVSNDESLYSFYGLAEYSSQSLNYGDLDKSFSLNQGNNSLSNISDLNLDDLGHYSDPLATNTASNAYIGKVGKDGQILLGQKEQSDLDRLYHSFDLQESSDNSLNTSSTQSTSRDTFNSTPNTSFNISNAKNAPATEDVNFPKSVSDAYRNVKLNNENQETRYLFVSRLPIPDEDDGQTLVSEVTAANNIYGQVKGIYVRHLTYTGCLVLSFNDFRHASTARKNILRDSRRNPAWGYRQLSADFIERDEVVKLAQKHFTTSFLSVGEGKLTLSASTTFQYEGLKAYFSALGDVKSFSIDPTSSAQESVNGRRSYLIEYFDDRCASRAWVDITNAENADLQIGWQDSSSLNTYLVEEINPSQPDTSQKQKSPRPPLPSSFRAHPDERFTRYKKTAWTESSSSRNSSPITSSPLPDGFKSATAFPSTPLNGNKRDGNALAHLGYVPNDPTRNNTAQWGLIRDDPVPDNNLIRFDRIMSGEDKRTSCILRNLPNRMTQLELMENLDEVVPREYDFVYLRFDFNSGSNCSYSFVNFTSSDALLRFWNARLGTFWDKDNSRKLCMGGMAAIQGKQALVERFRNSSVMDAKEEHQPKIFYSSGPMKGLPEPFPLSNNALRKARSSYATSVYGLYGSKPRGGFKHVLI